MISKAAFDLQIFTKYPVRTIRDSLKDVLRGENIPAGSRWIFCVLSQARRDNFLCDSDAIGYMYMSAVGKRGPCPSPTP